VSEEKLIKVHWILDQADHGLIEALANIEGVKIVQSDFSFDSAYEWTLHNEGEEIDVFFASEFAPVSTTDSEGKTVNRDTALLRRIRDLHLMRPQTKFVLICDDDRDRPENRHFLANLVAIGIYDFVVGTELTEEQLKQLLTEPPKDITHVQQYLPENIGTDWSSQPFLPSKAKPIKVVEEKKEKRPAIDIFAMIRRAGDRQESRVKPKVKHVIEKVRPSVVTFTSFGTNDADASFLAREFSAKLATKGAKVALVEFHNTGIPRMAFETGMMSTRKTMEEALQRIEDEEDVAPILLTPEDAANNMPHYDKALLKKIKNLPATFHILAGRPNVTPIAHPLKSIRGETLEKGPGELANQLVFRHGFDCVVFAVDGGFTSKLSFHSIKTSNYVFAVTDQNSAHVSWLRQNLEIIDNLKIPKNNIRIVVYPYYELPNLRLSDIEAALDTEVDYTLPDVNMELLNSTWGLGEVSSPEFHRTMAEMIFEVTGYKLGDLEDKPKKKGLFGKIKFFSRKKKDSDEKIEEKIWEVGS